jgi:hypothetical protein
LIYLDTSVLAAYYCPEPDSAPAERLVRGAPRPVLSDLTELELLSVLSRKTRGRDISAADATRVLAAFHAHLETDLYRRISIERRHFDLARTWLSRFSVPLRTLDALHLAMAAAEELPIATFDRSLARAAAAIGLETVSPT